MFTWVIIMALVALLSFYIGVSYERAQCEAASILAFEEAEDARVFAEWQAATPGLDIWRDPGMCEAFKLPRRPHLHVIHNTDADRHFDDLVSRGLVEPT